ncbi:MAG: nickel-responsive transcriptional regulator NikR [Chromatiales bacterium]|jgi:CopG family nickel-responsive transcriptional regulator
MRRFTITLDDQLVEAFEHYMSSRGYRNRSEAIRDLIRERLGSEQMEQTPQGDCMANLTYVYNHHERELASRLTRTQHDHHDLVVSTLHVHLDHYNCMETVILRGSLDRVQRFAHETISQSGVRHGRLYILPVTMTQAEHPHGSSDQAHRHVHIEPIS